jgi:aminoglycoside 6'-N-acetyltransferase I
MPREVQIRSVQENDLPEWLRMRHALWPDHSDEEHLAEMHDFLTHLHETPVFVAVRDTGQLGGFVESGTRSYAEGCDAGPVPYVEGWFVDDDLRRHGLGRALIEAVEQWAREQGFREIGSDCLLENSVSYQAHLALGYEEVERSIIFRKSLG